MIETAVAGKWAGHAIGQVTFIRPPPLDDPDRRLTRPRREPGRRSTAAREPRACRRRRLAACRTAASPTSTRWAGPAWSTSPRRSRPIAGRSPGAGCTWQPETASLVARGAITKGDVLAVARVAGIQAAKRASDLIPLCHPLLVGSVLVNFQIEDSYIEVEAQVETVDRTGVEMEALTACSVACLTIYDMCKSAERSMVIGDIALWEKTGGRSGMWRRGRGGRRARALGLSSARRSRRGSVLTASDTLARVRTSAVASGARPVARSRTATDDAHSSPYVIVQNPQHQTDASRAAHPPPGRDRWLRSPQQEGRHRSVTLLVLFILAVIWLAVLLPPWLQNRTATRPADSITNFRTSSRCSSAGPGRSPLTGSPPAAPTSRTMYPYGASLRAGCRPGARVPSRSSPRPSSGCRRPRPARRRRDVFNTLGGGGGAHLPARRRSSAGRCGC